MMLAHERRSQSFVIRPTPSRGAEGGESSAAKDAGTVLRLRVRPEEVPSMLPRRSRSWTEGAVEPAPPPALSFDDGSNNAISLADRDRARIRNRSASFGDVSAAETKYVEGSLRGGGRGTPRRTSRVALARVASERRTSNDIEAVVSDAWATLERLDDLVLGSGAGVQPLPTSPFSVVHGPGAAVFLDNEDGAQNSKSNGISCDGDDENDSIEDELDELKRFQDVMKKELDVSSLGGSAAQRFLGNEEEADLQELLRGSGLIVDFPEITVDDDNGCQVQQSQGARRNRRGLVRALLQITGDIGLALRLLQFWRRRQSEYESNRAHAERDVNESQQRQHCRQNSGKGKVS